MDANEIGRRLSSIRHRYDSYILSSASDIPFITTMMPDDRNSTICVHIEDDVFKKLYDVIEVHFPFTTSGDDDGEASTMNLSKCKSSDWNYEASGYTGLYDAIDTLNSGMEKGAYLSVVVSDRNHDVDEWSVHNAFISILDYMNGLPDSYIAIRLAV